MNRSLPHLGALILGLSLVSGLLYAAGEKKPAAKKGGDETVYSTPNGKRFHLDQKCTFLARSKTIQEGSKAEAERKGLTPCKTCAGEGNGKPSVANAVEPGKKAVGDVVFFSPSSKKFHASEKCTFLARSKTIDQASRAEAEKKGMTPCSTCASGKSDDKEAMKKGAETS